MPNYILYLAAGNIHYANQCRYSLLKFLSLYNLNPPGNIGISVHTDVPALFESFDPFFKGFELNEISGPLPLKSDLIRQTIQAKGGNVLYLDADCYFTAPADSVFKKLEASNSLFYTKSPIINNHVAHFQKLRELLSTNIISLEKQMPDLEKQDLVSTEAIGMTTTSVALLENISGLYSKLSGHLPHELSERIAYTYFTSDAAMQTLEDKIISYRNFPQFKNLLQLFFEKNEEESIPNLVKLVHHIDAQTILKEKKQFDRQPFVKKLLSALVGKAWSVRKYQNKF